MTESKSSDVAEAERIAALKICGLLDTDPEPAYDELAHLAADLIATPVALISLVDEERQWFKARVGLDAAQTSRDVAFCDFAIRQPTEILVVPDAREDERFRDNPLVTGPTRVIFYAGVPLRHPDGHALGTLCVIDHEPRSPSAGELERLRVLGRQAERLIELRLMVRERDRAVASLTSSNQELDAFARVAAHDLRAPLRRMATYVEFLREDLEDEAPPESREHMQELSRTFDDMSQLLANIVDLARSARSDLEWKEVDLQDCLRRALRLLEGEPAAGESEVDVVGSLPLVWGDARAYTQIFQNLVANALLYRRGDRAHVTVRAVERGGETFIEVEDRGLGIAPDRIGEIFNAFQRLDREGKFPGSGIGLSIVQRLVLRQHGRLEVESELGRGSLFRFSVRERP